MAVAGMVMQAVGMGGQIVGSERQGKMNAQMAEYNANIAAQNMVTVQQQANENARRSLVNSNKVMGAQAAGFGASGVSGTSAMDVMQETATKGELDALTIKNQGALKSTAYQNEVNLDKYRASNELVAGDINAFGGSMGGAGRLASMGSGGGGSGSDG